MNLTTWMKALGGLAAAVWAAPVPAAAQCVLCYLSAASSGAKGAQALRWGILVLILPTLALFGGVILLAIRRRNPVERAPDSFPAGHEDSERLLPLSTGQQSQSHPVS